MIDMGGANSYLVSQWPPVKVKLVSKWIKVLNVSVNASKSGLYTYTHMKWKSNQKLVIVLLNQKE